MSADAQRIIPSESIDYFSILISPCIDSYASIRFFIKWTISAVVLRSSVFAICDILSIISFSVLITN